MQYVSETAALTRGPFAVTTHASQDRAESLGLLTHTVYGSQAAAEGDTCVCVRALSRSLVRPGKDARGSDDVGPF